MHVTRRFLGAVPSAPYGGVDHFAIFNSFHVQLAFENDRSSGADMPMKMTKLAWIPAIQRTDMTRIINIQNGAPVTDREWMILVF